MKYLQLPGLCLLLSFVCATTSAQQSIPVNEPDQNKPKLFTNLPDRIPVDISNLQSLMNVETGKEASLKLGPNNIQGFSGKVVSINNGYDNIRSVVIRSSNFSGATLTLSSSTQPNGTVKFTGRIISFRHGDLYELQNQNNQYTLIKKNFYALINE
jgi:hypothetical protein